MECNSLYKEKIRQDKKIVLIKIADIDLAFPSEILSEMHECLKIDYEIKYINADNINSRDIIKVLIRPFSQKPALFEHTPIEQNNELCYINKGGVEYYCLKGNDTSKQFIFTYNSSLNLFSYR